MSLHVFSDSLLIAGGLIWYFLRLYLRDRRELRNYNELKASFKNFGLDRAVGSSGQSLRCSFEQLRAINVLAGLSDWNYKYDKTAGQYQLIDEDHGVILQSTPQASDSGRMDLAAKYHYIATFSPRLMVQILGRLQACEVVLHTIKLVTPEQSLASKLITLAASYHNMDWNQPIPLPAGADIAKGN